MKTITMLEIYKNARHEIARKYAHEEQINKKTITELGQENRIAINRMEKYDAQMDEIHNLIVEMEKTCFQ